MRVLFLLLQFFAVPILFGQAPIEIVSPAYVFGPATQDDNDFTNPYIFCGDTVLLEAPIATSGNQKKWVLQPKSENYVVLQGDSLSNRILIRLILSNVTEIKWKRTNTDVRSIFIQTQKPTTPKAGKDTTVCQNSLKLYANTPIIGTGKWYSLSNTAIFSDPTSPNAIVTNLPSGKETLVWEISSLCDTLQDTIVVNNRAIPKPNLGPDKKQCVDSVHLVYSGLFSGVWTKLGDPIFSDTNKYLIVSNLPLGISNFVWKIDNGSCRQSDTITVKYDIPKKAKIVSPFAYDTTVCIGTIKLAGENEGGAWRKKGETIDISSGQTLTINTLLPDSNIYYRIFNDPICGISIDSALIVYNKVSKPQLGSDQNVCVDSITLTAPIVSITGFWTKLFDGNTIYASSIKVNNLQLGKNLFAWTETKGICAESDTLGINYKIPGKAHITNKPKGIDTLVCSNKISLIGEGGSGFWTKKDSATRFSSSSITFTKLKSDTNVFYWTVEDPICGNTVDSIRVINKTVPIPNAGNDKISCSTSSTLNASNAISGSWFKLPNVFLGSSLNITITGLTKGNNLYYWISDNGYCVATDTVNVFYQETLEAKIQVPTNSDTAVCQNQIRLIGNGVGTWTKKDSAFSSINSSITFTGLKSDTNVFYWTVTDPVCGKAKDSVRVINKLVSKPLIVSDSCIQGIPTDSLSLLPKSVVLNGNSAIWSSESIVLKNNLTNHSAKFKPNLPGQYKFKFKVSNGICADSAFATRRIVTKVVLPNNICINKNRGDSALVPPIIATSPNYARGERGKWTVISKSSNFLQLSSDTNRTLVFKALRGVYIFEWTISAACNDCGEACTSKDTITITINNRANIIDLNSANLNVCITDSSYSNLRVNRLYTSTTVSETGTWSSRSGGLSFENIIQQPKVTDTTYSVSHLPIRKDTLYWTVQHVNGCPATIDSVFLSRLTLPKASVKNQCYPIDAPNLRDTLTGNRPNANETGFWGVDARLVSDKTGDKLIIKTNLKNIYQAWWVINTPSCTGFADTVRIKFISNPKVPSDTFFKVPFYGVKPVLKGNVTAPELGKWLNVEMGIISTNNQMLVPDSVQGIFQYRYQLSDPIFNCVLNSISNVTLITDPKINSNSCLKGVLRTQLTAKEVSTSAKEESIWEADNRTYNVSAAYQINDRNKFNIDFPNVNNIAVAGRVWIKHKVQSGKYTLVDSVLLTNLTYLDKPSILSNTKPCTDSNIPLNPAANFSKQLYEKAFWVKGNLANVASTISGKTANDTATNMSSGQHRFGFVVLDSTNLSCTDTAFVTVTKVTKAKASSDLTTCLTDTFKLLSANSYASVENGTWKVLSVNNLNSTPKFSNDTLPNTIVNALGNRNTTVRWTIKNKKDLTCTSTDSIRLVVLTKPQTNLKSSCVEFTGQGQFVDLEGNRSAAASYEVSSWLLNGKLLASTQNMKYTPDSAGIKNLVYTISDPLYKCNFSDTVRLRLVPKATINAQKRCIVLSNGQAKIDTLKVNIFPKVAGLSYSFNGNAITGVVDSIQRISHNLPNNYTNKWEISLAGCSSKDSVITTVISKANAGSDTCLIESNNLSLKGNTLANGEVGKWTVLKGNVVFDSDTSNKTKATFNIKGLTTLKWKITNGSCVDFDSIKVSSITKSSVITNSNSCLVGQDTITLKGFPISANEKAIWQKIATKNDTLVKGSSVKVQLSFGVNRFGYIIFDPEVPTCSSKTEISISVLKKMNALFDGCNNYDPIDQANIVENLDAKPNVAGLTYQWKKDSTLVGDTIMEDDNSSRLQYNRIGKRKLWLKSFVTDDPFCRDSVSKIVRVVSKVTFALDTCITSPSFKLIPKMYPDFKTGEYLRVSVGPNPNQITIRQPSDSINGYSKGSYKVNLTVFDSDGLCSVNWDKTSFNINYITKAAPLSDTICKYYDSKLEEKLTTPQILSATEQGSWRSENVRIDTTSNIAKEFKLGKNVLKWVISSKSDASCTSDSTVNYYTLTSSGFKEKNIYTCVTDTIINALKPSATENVKWSASLNLTRKSDSDNSITLQNLSNDIADTVIRTISLGGICPLSDTVIVLNRQLRPFKISTQDNQTGTDSVLYTCQKSINLIVPDVDKDISGANFSWSIQPVTTSKVDNFIYSQFTNLISNRQYLFVGSGRNANCPFVRDTLKLVTREGLGGIPISKSDTVCDLKDYEVKNLNINLGFTPDKADWTPIGSSLTLNKPNETNPNNVIFQNLEVQNNDVDFKVTKNGCEATMRIRIINNHQLDTVKLGIGSFDKQVCDNSTFRLSAIKPNLSDADTNFFNYYWAEDKLGQKKIGLKNRKDTASVIVANDGLAHPYYFVVKNGVCAPKDTLVYLQNFQQIDSISAGTNDTICATKINLKGYKNQSFSKGTWYNLTNGDKDSLASNFNPTVKLESSTLNIFRWKVTNGVCEKNDTLKILVGDSISTAKVKQKEIIDCDTGDVLLKGNNPVLNSGKGFWWKKPNETLVNDSIVLYDLVSQLEKESFVFYYTIKNNYCSTTDSTIVRYFKTPSKANAGPDQTLVKKQTVMNANQPEVGIGTWRLKQGEGAIEGINNPNANITYLVFGDNVFIWSISNGETCKTSEDEVILAFSDFEIPQAFSPNGDGKNDRFEIVGLENYSGSKLKVLNRWGREVYASDDYQNNWDGASLEEDTYFFLLEIPGIELKKGYVVIKRK